MVKHKPHEELPMVTFGSLAGLLTITQLVEIGNIHAAGIAAYLAMFAAVAAVLAVVRQWRYG